MKVERLTCSLQSFVVVWMGLSPDAAGIAAGSATRSHQMI